MLSNSLFWQSLVLAQQRLTRVNINDLFKQDPQRAAKYSISAADLFLDYSKNQLDDSALSNLLALAESVDLKANIQALFNGALINQTENRPALHTALRQQTDSPIKVNGENIIPSIRAVQQQMRFISEQLRQGAWLGTSGTSITDVVNIGIGGSDLGPVLVTQALAKDASSIPNVHFIANVDAVPLQRLLVHVNPATTLFIIASKSFSTQETLANANTAKCWLKGHLGEAAMSKHLLAVTAHPQKAQAYGIAATNILPFWDWVGGRYSLWSAIGLSIAIAIGMDNFNALLQGASAMDRHFQQAPLAANMPVILALLGIWYINFFHAHTHAVIPYTEALRSLPAYLQQLDMESNGKRVTNQGELVNYHTAPIIWGAVGTNSQHACHQLLHQGTERVPVDFIIPLQAESSLTEHQDILFANCLAQAQALMMGNTAENYKAIPGNKPSNMLLMNRISPHTLGALIALYEHKVFVQGVIWNINSFDQWGVELGKQLGNKILASLSDKNRADLDPSTQQILQRYVALKH